MTQPALYHALAPGQLLFVRGEEGDSAYVVVAGTLVVTTGERALAGRGGASGGMVRYLGPGEIVGEMALAGERTRTATVTAGDEPVTLIRITHDYLSERLAEADPLVRHLLAALLGRCRDLIGLVQRGGPAASADAGAHDDDSARAERLLDDFATTFTPIDPGGPQGAMLVVTRGPTPAMAGLTLSAADLDASLDRLRGEHAIGTALDERQFLLTYQPVVRLADRRTVGFEALLRWQRDGQWVRPDSFLATAERSGQIDAITRWAVETAVEAAAGFESLRRERAPTAPPIAVSVNLTGPQIADPTLLDHLLAALARFRLAPAHLKIELTESVMVRSVDAARAFVERARSHGIVTMIDDFGTGYCSLAYLHHFPVGVLKIDQFFLRSDSQNPAARPILRAAHRLAGELGLDTLVEGVETADQAAWLAAEGVRLGQGYHFAPPLSLTDARHRLIAEWAQAWVFETALTTSPP